MSKKQNNTVTIDALKVWQETTHPDDMPRIEAFFNSVAKKDGEAGWRFESIVMTYAGWNHKTIRFIALVEFAKSVCEKIVPSTYIREGYIPQAEVHFKNGGLAVVPTYLLNLPSTGKGAHWNNDGWKFAVRYQ